MRETEGRQIEEELKRCSLVHSRRLDSDAGLRASAGLRLQPLIREPSRRVKFGRISPYTWQTALHTNVEKMQRKVDAGNMYHDKWRYRNIGACWLQAKNSE